MTDSTAVARKTGGSESGTGRQLLDHAHLHAALRPALQHDIVHEAPHEKDSPAARFQNVFRCKRVSNLAWLEPLSLIDDADDELARIGNRHDREFDRHHLAVVLAIAVLDRVDDGLADRDA